MPSRPSHPAGHPPAAGVVAAVTAAALGVGHALVSLYWALGGTGLLDTIGGDLERWGRERRPPLVAGLWAVVAVKLVVALVAPVLAGVGAGRLPPWFRTGVARALGWVAAVTLVAYGGVLTIVGLAVQSGAIDATADADHRALAWHAYLWDPWFLLWGLAFCASLWATRPHEAR
ncbi:MAG TPA: DUF3995 domain-containing protein [Acidimicrobiales bacterium]